MQNDTELEAFTLITPTAEIAVASHGGRAKCLQRLVRLDMPVPTTVALNFATVHQIAAGHMPNTSAILDLFGQDPLLSVRPSSEDPDWGGPGAILNIGMTDSRHKAMSETIGASAATALYLRFIHAYAVHVARLDPDMFLPPDQPDQAALTEALRNYQDETGEAFPQDPSVQLSEVLRSMARAWEGTTARFPIHRIYCVGRNYAAHAIEMGHDPDREPPFFFQKNPDNILPSGEPFPYPVQSNDVHHAAAAPVGAGF